jgi:DNA polymerase (family 10)
MRSAHTIAKMPRRTVRSESPAPDERAVPRLPAAPNDGAAVTAKLAGPEPAPAAEPQEAGPAAAVQAPGEGGLPGAEPARLANGDLGRIFHEIGDILEVKGELSFKTAAYHRAADSIARAPFDVAAAYRAGARPPIPGVGRAISDKIEELARTGRLEYHERLRAEIPASLIDLLRIPGVGPRTVRLVHAELGVETIEDLRRAAGAGHLRDLRGFSRVSEARILEAIAQLEARSDRMLLDRAQTLADELVTAIRDVPGVHRVVVAGSLRRRRETVGDLDLLVETGRPQPVVERFTTLASVDRVLGAGRHKASIVLRDGPQVDMMIMPPGEAGTYLVHFTGSAAHNVRLRGLARDRGWSLSEKGYLRLDEDGEPLAGDRAELRIFPDEAAVYAFLDLPLVEPELREDRGEIEAARDRRLPTLITRPDLRGDLHSHSDWSDGVHSIERMAEAARALGYAYLVLTDHSQSLAIAHGLDPRRVEQQRGIIARLNDRFAAEEAGGRAPDGSCSDGFRLLHGCELEIRADGRLDFEDGLLARFDLVVASLHVSRRQPRADLTRRTLSAIRSPHVDVVAHPAGRMIQSRDDLDLDWEAVLEAAAATGTALEVNGSPHRLDLSAERARRAIELGCLLAINSDAHRTEELDYVRWGIDQARRAWVQPRSVVNTWTLAELLAWVSSNADRT